ncbi:hypothetical protein [Heyndrickxia sporothermodurans]
MIRQHGMKIKFKFPPKGEKDAFSQDLTRTEWIFKVFGWLVIIGTLKYAAASTGHAAFNFWALGLTIEIGWLAFSFISNRMEIEIVSYNGNKPYLRTAANIIFATFVGWLAWQSATWIVNDVANEFVEFNKHGRSS